MQMFDVALSRRMCCSRVASAIRYAVCPWASTDTPMMRPGIWRTYAVRVAKNAAWGPPHPSGTPNRCEFPNTTSAPISPGGVRIASERRSAPTATRTPALCALSMSGRKSCTTPTSSGYSDQYAKGDGAAARLEQHGVVGHHLDVDVERRRAAAQHVDRLWKTAVAYQEHAARIAIACRRCRRVLRLCGAHTVQQRHRFRRRRRLVEQRGVRHLHAREVGDHCLEVQEGFETALRDLRLIWRVRQNPPGFSNTMRRTTLGVTVS